MLASCFDGDDVVWLVLDRLTVLDDLESGFATEHVYPYEVAFGLEPPPREEAISASLLPHPELGCLASS